MREGCNTVVVVFLMRIKYLYSSSTMSVRDFVLSALMQGHIDKSAPLPAGQISVHLFSFKERGIQ